MTLIFLNFILAILGIAFTAFGLIHSTRSYPGPVAFARLAAAMPALWAVSSFALGILALLVGLVLLVPTLWRLRRGQAKGPVASAPRSPFGQRPVRGRRDDDFDEDPEAFDDDDYRGGAGSGYASPYGGGFDGRHHNNGELDDRRRTGIYR